MISLCPFVISDSAKANSINSLEVAGFNVSWPQIMYMPTGCSLFEFKYINNAPYAFLQVGFKLTDLYGGAISDDSLIGAPPGRSGIWDEQICAQALNSGLGPYKIKIFVQDYSSRGGGTLEKYANIYFTARPGSTDSGSTPKAPDVISDSAKANSINSLEVAGFNVSWPQIMYMPTGCSLFEFKYINNAPYAFLQVGFKLTDLYGGAISDDSLIGAPPGRSGIWDEQICAQALNSGLGPYKIKIFVQDYSSRGGGTLEKYANIYFTSTPKAPDAPSKLVGALKGTAVDYTFESLIANPEVTKYEVAISTLITPNQNPENVFSWGAKTILKDSTTKSFSINKDDISRYYASGYAAEMSPSILITVRAINSLGSSNWSNGVYTLVSVFGLSPYVKTVAVPTPPASPPVAQVKNTTITCVKGKLTKKVSAVKPKCPAGYKKK